MLIIVAYRDTGIRLAHSVVPMPLLLSPDVEFAARDIRRLKKVTQLTHLHEEAVDLL